MIDFKGTREAPLDENQLAGLCEGIERKFRIEECIRKPNETTYVIKVGMFSRRSYDTASIKLVKSNGSLSVNYAMGVDVSLILPLVLGTGFCIYLISTGVNWLVGPALILFVIALVVIQCFISFLFFKYKINNLITTIYMAK